MFGMGRKLVAFGLLLSMSVAAGCAPLAVQHRGDAAFRSAVLAQLSYDDARAETLYREILALGLDWSPVWNNLAVIAVHRKQYPEARKLLAQAVAANEHDLVALTNYGVMSFHLADYNEARRTLAEARQLRRRLIDSIPSNGRTDWDELHFARATESLDKTAEKYLARIDMATLTDAPVPSGDLLADLSLQRF
jgi:tetratricopeptide (TPR) repeat protein